MSQTKLFAKDIQKEAFLIRGWEARLVTDVTKGVATYCKFSAETGEPYGQTPGACTVKTLLGWAERLASPDEVAGYDQEMIIESSRLASEKWVAGMQNILSSEFLSGELERRGILPARMS